VENITEKAREVGRLISQTDEYKALKRANEQIGDDRESVELMNRLRDLEEEITALLRAGREPGEEVQEEYGKVAEQIQQRSAYQAVVAAQANFDRLMGRINEEIARGVEVGEQSRIIFP
jgi:cell fate (sporulation/competence/biofilm development) regulator YlbF (YheA/YmcA/DUF963 family)